MKNKATFNNSESPTKARQYQGLWSRYEVKASLGHIRDLPKAKLGVDIEMAFSQSTFHTGQRRCNKTN